MSSGGGFAPSQNSSNVATNSTPTTSQTAPAPSGGKGGYNSSPMKMEDFAQQQPQVYMPPAQPTFYDQAFTNSYYNPGFQRPRMDYGLGGMGNAYARRAQFRSQSSPFNAPKPPGEMQYSGEYAPQAPAGLQNNPDYVPSGALREVRAGPDGFMPGQLMSDSWSRRRNFGAAEYAGPTNQTPQYGGPGLGPPRLEQSGLGSLMGGMLDANDPMYGMPSAPPSMPVNEAGIDMNQAFNTYRKEMQDWQNKTGMTPDQWYAKRDEGIAFRNKQAAQSPVAAPPPISQAGQAVSTGSRTGLGALLGGY